MRLVFCDHLRSRAGIVRCLLYCGLLNVKLNSPILTLTDLKQVKARMQFIPSVVSTILWYLGWQIKRCVNSLLRACFHAGECWCSGWQFESFHTLKTTKLRKKPQKPASPNPAGAVSAACHETSVEFANFWYVNESLKSSTHRDEQYLQRAVPPVTRWANFEISAYGSCAYAECCRVHSSGYKSIVRGKR